jgi:membrane protein implicated in regulation of membrane protease activity
MIAPVEFGDGWQLVMTAPDWSLVALLLVTVIPQLCLASWFSRRLRRGRGAQRSGDSL